MRIRHPIALAALLGCLAPLQAAADAAAGAPPTIVNSLGMVLVRIPAGEFRMGSDESLPDLAASFPQVEVERLHELADEKPVHRVRITRDFMIGRHHVTVGQFAQFVARSGHRPESVREGRGAYGYDPVHAAEAHPDAFAGRDMRYSWRDPGFVQTDDHPVVNVSWNDAVAMAEWLSRTERRRYRLPREAEWEYACRGGRDARYPHGDDPRQLVRFANTFDRDSAVHWPRFARQAVDGHDGFPFTAPVGSFPANGFGLHDMAGNAWQWTADWYADDAYAASPVDDPAGPPDGHVRVRRGGSWHTWALYARCSYRNFNTASSAYPLVGFRLVLEIDDEPGGR